MVSTFLNYVGKIVIEIKGRKYRSLDKNFVNLVTHLI